MMTKEASAEATVRNIRRMTRRKYTAEEKIRIVLESLRGDLTIAGAKTSLKPGNHALLEIQCEKPTASR